MGAQLFVTIASWPSARVAHWTALNRARAIENQAFTVACNRIGTDPALTYPGASTIIDFTGETLCSGQTAEGVLKAELDIPALLKYRQDLPFLKDMRHF
jgi:predicted amidohydrolase